MQRRVDDRQVARPAAGEVDHGLRGSGRGSRRRAPRPPVPAGDVRDGAHRRDRAARSPRRPAARSGCRRRGRPCSRCPAAGCGSRSPSPRRRSPGRGWRRPAAAWAADGAARSASQPGAGHHLGGVAGEDVGVVAGVVPDHDGVAGLGAVLDGGTPPGRPPRAARRRGSSGWGRRRAHRAGRRCRTRGSRRTGRRARRSSPLSISASSSALRHRVGVLGRPGAGAVEQVGVGVHASEAMARAIVLRRGGGAAPRRAGRHGRPGRRRRGITQTCSMPRAAYASIRRRNASMSSNGSPPARAVRRTSAGSRPTSAQCRRAPRSCAASRRARSRRGCRRRRTARPAAGSCARRCRRSGSRGPPGRSGAGRQTVSASW